MAEMFGTNLAWEKGDEILFDCPQIFIKKNNNINNKMRYFFICLIISLSLLI